MNVSVIGGGSMGEALISRLKSAGLKRLSFWTRRASRRAELAKRFRIHPADNLIEATAADVIFLAIPATAQREVFRGARLPHNGARIFISLAPDLKIEELTRILRTQNVMRIACSPAIAQQSSLIMLCCRPRIRPEALRVLGDVLKEIQVLSIPESQFKEAVALLCVVAMQAHVLVKVKESVVRAGLDSKLAGQISKSLTSELQLLFKLTDDDPKAALKLCRSPNGIVDALAKSLDRSDLNKTLAQLLRKD